jgi:hypothetical protein
LEPFSETVDGAVAAALVFGSDFIGEEDFHILRPRSQLARFANWTPMVFYDVEFGKPSL